MKQISSPTKMKVDVVYTILAVLPSFPSPFYGEDISSDQHQTRQMHFCSEEPFAKFSNLLFYSMTEFPNFWGFFLVRPQLSALSLQKHSFLFSLCFFYLKVQVEF